MKNILLILILFSIIGCSKYRTKGGTWNSLSYSGYTNFNSSEKYLDLNVYETDETTCKDVEPSSNSSCYYSKKLEPKIEKYKLSGGKSYKANFRIKLLDQNYEPTIGFGLNLQFIGITGSKNDTHIDGKQFPAIGFDLWLYDNHAVTVLGIKPTITYNYTTTPYSPFYVVGKNNSGTEKWTRGKAQYQEQRVGVSLRLGGEQKRNSYGFFSLDIEQLINSKINFESKTMEVNGTSISISLTKMDF